MGTTSKLKQYIVIHGGLDSLLKVGNLKRENTAAIATVMTLNLAKSKLLLKPIEDSHVKTRKFGPQQLCQITFKGEEESVSSIKTELKSYSCYNFHRIIVMHLQDFVT